MAFNVPKEEQPEFNKKVQSGLNLFAKDVQRTLGQLEVLQPQTLVEAYNQPVQPPVLPDLTPLERYVYAEQPNQEVADIATPPARESMVVPREDPNLYPEFANQAQAQFSRDAVSITPYEQAVTDVVGAEVDSLRNDAGEIAKSPLEVFSKPLNANSVRALGLVDQDGNPTERGQLFYNLQQSGMFNDDGTINEKGQAYLTPIEEMEKPEWFKQPGSKEKFDILWEDGVIRSSSTPGEILSNVTKFVGDAVYGGAELAQQQAMGLAYNSRTWGGLLGMEDSRPDYLKARGEATELSIAENMYKNVIQTSNLIDVGLAADKQFIDESIMSPFYGALEKITGIQRPQPQEIDQANANIKNSKDALVAARYNQWATDQRLANMEAGEIGETFLGIDNAVQKAEAAKQELGETEFNNVYGRVGAFTNVVLDPTNAVTAAFAVKASRAVPLSSRAMLNAQKTMGNIAAMDLAIAQGNTAVQASRAVLAKVEPTVNLAQRMAANFAEGAKTQPALLERSAKASQIASRVTAEANQIRSTLPTITAELDSLITKRNSLATRIPEAYSQKVLQTMELGRQMRAMPAKAVGATLERVGDTISKTDTAVTNFLQERGLDQMYTAAVGAAGVVGLAGNPIIGALGAGAAALKTGRVLSNYGKLFRYVGKEMENVRGQIPFWKRVAAHTAPGSLGRGFAHTFNMLDLGGVTSDTLRRTGRGIAAAAPTDLMFEYLSDGADMRPETMYQAAVESLVIGGSFAAAGGAFMGTKKRMRELSIGDELNFRRNLTDTRQKALFEAIPAGTRRAISTYAIANPTLNYTFKDSGASRYDPNTNTAVINVNSTNPIKALVAHETLHHTVIKNNMEPGISALFLGDTKNNTVGGLFRSRDGKLDPNFEAFRDGYYKRLGVEGMSNAERDAIYPLDKIAVEYFIEKHADQYAAMAESGELGAVASSGAARRKLGSILETVLPRIPVLKDLHFKSGGMIDKNGAWVTGNGILDAEGVKRDPITNKMFRDMNRRSAGLVPGQFDPLMSDKPDSGAPILLNPSDSIDAELLHPLVQVDDANKPIMKDGKPVALDRATELSRALAGLTAVEVMRRKRAENYAPEKGEAHVDDEGQFQPGWLSNDVLTEMFAKNKYNPEQKRIIREMNKLIRKGAGDRVVMINFPATTRNKAGKVVYKPQGATLRDTVPVAVTISKDGNLLFGLMSVTKLHENIQKRSQDRRGKKLYGGNVDLILRDTQAMMDYHKQGLDSIEFFKQKYGAVEADERKKFINTMFGLLNQKEQAVLNPMLLEDGIKSKDNVYRTYRADRVSKAVPMAPEEYAAMPFSYEAVSQVRMPEAQRAMPEGEQGGDVTLTRLREIRDGLDENLTEREAIDELDFIINDAPSGYFPQDILNKVDQAKRDLEEEFTTWAGRGDSEASTESAISSVMSFLDSKESGGQAAPTRFMPEGVDEDKFYSQLERVITDKVPTRATAQQIMATIDPTRGSGVKADEIKWSGIEQALASLEKDGKVSKEDLLNYLRNEGRVRFEEVVSSEFNKDTFPQGWSFRLDSESDDGSGLVIDPQGRMFADADNESHARQLARDAAGAAPKFSQYVLPGGENYREVVLAMAGRDENKYKAATKAYRDAIKADASEQELDRLSAEIASLEKSNDYTSSHFPDIPNYVAHMRTNERTLDDGSEGLFVEEFQSDRHQAGRKQGYDDKTENGLDVATREFNSIVKPSSPATPSEVQQLVLGNLPGDTEWARKALGDNFERIRDLARQDMRGIQDAPFRTTWPLQLFKRALRDAVDGGKDWVGWTVGDTQNERFDLSKQVDSISTDEMIGYPDGFRAISIKLAGGNGSSSTLGVDQNGNVVSGWGNTGDAYAGKNIAEVIGKDISEKIMNGKLSETYKGDDLKMGGSGMRGFYDNMLPKEVGKYVKQFGGKVEKADMTQSVEADIMSGEEAETGSVPIWKVNITPEMRKISQTGQMRFMPEGEAKIIDSNIPDKEGGKMRPSTWDSLSKVGYSPEASEKTQIATTAPTYESIVKANATQGMEVLDFSAGRGIGTKAMKAIGKRVGFNVEGYEPFSNEKTRVVAPEYEGEDAINQIPDNSKDIIINNAVLNVVPEDTGRQIVNQIYSKLKPGGSAFINVMGWNNIKNRLDNPKTQLVGPREVVTQKGTFQKGYTAQSLRALIEQELPDAKIVRTSHGDIGFKVTKPAPPAETMPVINQPAKTGQMRFLPEPVEKLSAFKGKRVQVLTSDLSLVGDVKYGSYTAKFQGGPGYLDNDGWGFTDKDAADGFVTRWERDGKPLIGLASLGSANHLNSLASRKAYAEKWKYLIKSGNLNKEEADAHIKEAMSRVINSDAKKVKPDWRNAAKMITNADDLSNYFDKIPWAAAPMFYEKLTAKTLPIKYPILVENGLDLESVANEYRQPEYQGADIGDLYAIAEYNGSTPEYRPDLNQAYPWRIKFTKKATLSEMHNVADLTTDPRAFTGKIVGGALAPQPLMVTGIQLDKLISGDIKGSVKPISLQKETLKTKSNKAKEFSSGNPKAYKSYEQIMAERELEKSKPKAKGNASAIANAAKLK